MSKSINPFSVITQVIAVGSVDGICTTSALLRLIGRKADEIGLEFCQAFTVDKIAPSTWQDGRKVALVDLAVNNRDAEMTRAFVARVKEAGHEIVAVIDEHNRADWLEVLGSFLGLIVEPQDQNEEPERFGSSGDVLLEAIEQIGVGDTHVVDLLDAAAAGDHMDFTTHFGAMVNQAVKSRIQDDTRRVHLARRFAESREPDEAILGWIAEYEQILANHDTVVASRQDLGQGIHRVSAKGLAVDMTTLMGRLYGDGARVVALEGEAFNKALGRKTLQIAFGSRDKGLDLFSLVKGAVPSASGFANKVNVEPADEEAAINAIKAAL